MSVQRATSVIANCARWCILPARASLALLALSCNLDVQNQLPAGPAEPPRRDIAEPPREWVDTTYNPPVGGSTYQVRTNCNGVSNCYEDLQLAVNDAQLGDILELEAGATFVGPLTLPSKPGNAWLYIRSSAHASLPGPGQRVTPADASLMPKILLTGGYGAVRTAFGAHHYRLIGLEITTDAFPHESLVTLGTDGVTEDRADVLEEIPHDIIFDRVYVHGEPGQDLHFGFILNGERSAVIDSYISEVHSEIFDAKGFHIYNTPGVIKIANNYIEAAAEHVMIGEGVPSFPNLVPADIEVRSNHGFKPLSWNVDDPSYGGNPWLVKNCFEIKNGRRVLVDSNVFENNWAMAQDGDAILLTPRNTGNQMPWATVEDITFTRNSLLSVDAGIESLGEDDLQALGSDQTKRIVVSDNFLEVRREAFHIVLDVPNGRPVADVAITHNTIVHLETARSIGSFSTSGGVFPVLENVTVRDNIFSHGEFGVFGSGVGTGTVALDTYARNYGFVNNALFGAGSNDPTAYPAGNFHPQSAGDVGFVDHAGGNFELSASSPYSGAASDGSDLGANMRFLNGLAINVIAGIATEH